MFEETVKIRLKEIIRLTDETYLVDLIYYHGLLYFAAKYFAKYFTKQSILHMNITDCFKTC